MKFETDSNPKMTATLHRETIKKHGDRMDPDTKSAFLVKALSAEGQTAAERAVVERENRFTDIDKGR